MTETDAPGASASAARGRGESVDVMSDDIGVASPQDDVYYFVPNVAEAVINPSRADTFRGDPPKFPPAATTAASAVSRIGSGSTSTVNLLQHDANPDDDEKQRHVADIRL